jgi:hypothetical protein
VPGEQVGDALGPHRGLVVHPPRPERPGPQGAAFLIGDHGGLLRVHLLLARHERAPSRLARARAPDLYFRAVEPQRDAAGGGIGEHVSQGPQPDAGLSGHGEPAGGQQRPDLADRAGDRGPVDLVQLGQRRVRELEPQVNKGDDDPVGERQAVIRARSGRAQPLVLPAGEQPVFPGGGPRRGQLTDQPGQPSAADPGPDTIRQGRAGQS